MTLNLDVSDMAKKWLNDLKFPAIQVDPNDLHATFTRFEAGVNSSIANGVLKNLKNIITPTWWAQGITLNLIRSNANDVKLVVPDCKSEKDPTKYEWVGGKDVAKNIKKDTFNFKTKLNLQVPILKEILRLASFTKLFQPSDLIGYGYTMQVAIDNIDTIKLSNEARATPTLDITGSGLFVLDKGVSFPPTKIVAGEDHTVIYAPEVKNG
jgi:hypothetical protein